MRFGNFYRWRDRRGCVVRIDVVRHYRGPGALRLGAVQFIRIGEPVGTPFDPDTPGSDGHLFIWDPAGALDSWGVDSGQRISTSDLPSTASATGYQLDDTQFWLDQAQPTVAYAVRGERAKVLVEDVGTVIGCA